MNTLPFVVPEKLYLADSEFVTAFRPLFRGHLSHSAVIFSTALPVSLYKPFPWVVGFFFVNTERSLELWTVIAGISGLDD